MGSLDILTDEGSGERERDVGIILIKLWHCRSALGTITSSFLSLSMSHQKKKYFNFISFSIPISK